MQNTVKCPKCHHEFNVDDVVARQVEEQIEKKYQERYAKDAEKLAAEQNALKKREALLNQQAAEQEKQIAEKTQAAVALREKEITKLAEEKVRTSFEVELKTEKERAAEAEKQLAEHKKTQIENERLKRQLETQKQDIELDWEKKTNETLKIEREKIAKREAERNEEQLAELRRQLEDQKKLTAEMQRKQEQGSQQLQGEIQELAIEEFLKQAFPFDQVSEVKKGQFGADVTQIVRNSLGKEVGTILYESKNTQNFGGDWIEKLKTDGREAKADMLVIVTKAMPKDMEHTALKDGVWICPVNEFQGMAKVLREGLVRVGDAYASQNNKEGKATRLYDYLTSPKFKDQIERVLKTLRDLQEGYEKEKKSMMAIWKKRDSQLETIRSTFLDSWDPIERISGEEISMLGAPEDELLALGNELGV